MPMTRRLGRGVAEVVDAGRTCPSRSSSRCGRNSCVDHVGPGGACRVEGTADMHGEVASRLSASASGRPAKPDDPGVVDHDVDASEPVDGGIDERLAAATVDTSLVSAIAVPPASTISAATVAGRLVVGSVSFHGAPEVVDDDAGAAFGQQEGVGPSRCRDRRRSRRRRARRSCTCSSVATPLVARPWYSDVAHALQAVDLRESAGGEAPGNTQTGGRDR